MTGEREDEFLGILNYWLAIELIFVAGRRGFGLIADRVGGKTTGGQNE